MTYNMESYGAFYFLTPIMEKNYIIIYRVLVIEFTSLFQSIYQEPTTVILRLFQYALFTVLNAPSPTFSISETSA